MAIDHFYLQVKFTVFSLTALVSPSIPGKEVELTKGFCKGIASSSSVDRPDNGLGIANSALRDDLLVTLTT